MKPRMKTKLLLLSALLFFSQDSGFLNASVHVFVHDSAGRLTAAGYSGGKSIGYTYDPAGNLTLRAIVISTDTDGDGMDDAWELQYFTDLSRNGSGDFDGDGATDLAEFLAGTLPNNAASVFKILPNPSVASGSVTVQWQAVTGRTYRLQFKNSLSQTNWQDVLGDVAAGGPVGSKVDATAAGQKNRSYRVMLVP